MNLSELESVCRSCSRCGLCTTRTNVVFGEGNPDARLMFVGEGPGENEDKSGRPFVGKAGELLDKMLAAVGIDRSEVYIANTVKCRPPKNRNPEAEEIEACIDFLREQVRQIKPRIIVCLGKVSACRLIDPEFKVTKQHGVWNDKGGIRFMGTYHPAALLRNPESKEAAFGDFLLIRDEYFSL